MPIDSLHPRYKKYQESWVDCRDAFDGQLAVKAAGTRYLPKLSGQTNEEYNAYKKRALFYSITSKTLSALMGMAMDQPPSLEYPEKMKSYFDDGSGVQFWEAFSTTVQEILLTGRFGVLVDRPMDGGAPYPVLYPTESIINWRTSDNGQLTMVVLQETYVEPSGADPYVVEEKIRYRRLEIIDDLLQITVSLKGTGKDYVDSAPTTIYNTGLQMDFIPFFCATPTGLSIEPVKPPMQDIVDINLSHYRSSADLEHGRHFTGLPTPYVIGAESQAKMHIGSTTAWVIPDASAKVGYLEFTGQGLMSLEKALAEKQSQLASLSARMIDNSTRGSEAAETVKLRYMSETASLKAIVRSAQAILSAVYTTIAFMEGLDKNGVKIKLGTDFLDTKLSANELTAWTNAYLGGSISKEIFVHALKTGRALPPPGEDMGIIPDPPIAKPPAPAPSPAPAPVPPKE